MVKEIFERESKLDQKRVDHMIKRKKSGELIIS